MMEHDELISEKEQMDKMPVGERIRLGKKRRKQQLVYYDKYNRRESNQRSGSERVKRLKFTTDITLLEIASRGAVDEMQSLLKAGANSNMANHDGLTAMHQCCIDGSIEMVSLLLKARANVNLTDRDLWTPLHAAATCGHLQICQMLIKAGANLTAVNGDGDMPYDITEDEETLQYLENEMIKRGITQDSIEKARTSFHDSMMQDVKNLIKAKSFLDFPQDQGGTLLHVAISNGFEDIAELLMKNGAPLIVEDEDGWQPIHVAAFWGMGQVLELLARDYSVNLRVRTHLGETPYELCDDPDLKGLILDILNENPIDTDNDNEEFGEEINITLKTENGENSDSKKAETVVFQDKIETQNSDTGTTSGENKENENYISIENRENENELELNTHPIVNDHSNERMVAERRGSMKEIKLNASFRTRSNSDLAKRIKSISSNMKNNENLHEESSNAGNNKANEEFYENETYTDESLVPIQNQINLDNSSKNLQTFDENSTSHSESNTHKTQIKQTQNKTASFPVVQNDIISNQNAVSEESGEENYESTQQSEDMTTTTDDENKKNSNEEKYISTIINSDEIYETTVHTYNDDNYESISQYENLSLTQEKERIPHIIKKSITNEENKKYSVEKYKSTENNSDELYETTVHTSNDDHFESISPYEKNSITQEEKEGIPAINTKSVTNESDSESNDENYENLEKYDNIYENESNVNELNIQTSQQHTYPTNKSSNATSEIKIAELTPPPTPDTSPVILRNKSATESYNSNNNNDNTTISPSNNSNQMFPEIVISALEVKRNKSSVPIGIQRNSLQYIKWQRQQSRLSRTEESTSEQNAIEYPSSTWYTPTMFQPPMTIHKYTMNTSEFVGKKKKKKKNDKFVKKEKGCVIM